MLLQPFDIVPAAFVNMGVRAEEVRGAIMPAPGGVHRTHCGAGRPAT
jgi:hypothetical protein